MPSNSEEKTEQATPKKREDERKKGNIFQSQDVVSSLSILVIFSVLKLVFPYAYQYFCNFTIHFITCIKSVNHLSISTAKDLLYNAGAVVLLLSAPALVTSVVVAVVATGMQTRFKFSHESIKFKLSNISPIQGFAKLFTLRSAIEVLKAMLKTAVCIYIIYQQILKISGRCVAMMYSDIYSSSAAVMNDIMDLVMQLCLVFMGLSALDYLYQWWEYERKIKMTKQEVKEEFKQMEGDPEVKGRIRQLQRRMARQRMMQQVPTADVVVKNPTHFAVALRYKADKDSAPVVVAKGQDYVALKIIEIAQRHNIPTKEDRPLARALYASVEVGREIPSEFYQALAEVMAWVYRLKQERR